MDYDMYKIVELIIEELPSSIILLGFNDTTMYIENSMLFKNK